MSRETNEALDGTIRFTVRVSFFAVIAITFLCFLPDIHNDLLLTWDDGASIVDNFHIRSLNCDTIQWAFSEPYCNDWLPLFWLSFALDYAAWGLNPKGYHLTNNIIHSINAGLFFLLSFELLKGYLIAIRRKGGNSALLTRNRVLYCSLFAALFFAIHPLRVESVSWATERKDVLSFFFGILAALAYLRHVRAPLHRPQNTADKYPFLNSTFYWSAVALYCFSLLSKPMLVTLPLVLLILNWYPLNRFCKRNIATLLLEITPFTICAGLNAVITMAAHSGATMPLSESDTVSRLFIAFKSIMDYLRLTVWPASLSPFYLHPGNVGDIGAQYMVPVLFFLAVTICCVRYIKQWPVFMTVWLIYLVTLLPVLGLTQFSLTAMADRFTYVPGLALSFLIALAATVLLKAPSSRMAMSLVVSGSVLILLILGSLTMRQISFWKDDVSLWSRAIDVQPHFSGRMYFQRSLAYGLKEEYPKALADINEAYTIATRKKIQRMDKIFAERARILRKLGDLNGALADYSSAIRSDDSPQRSMYYYERGTTYKEMGKLDLANKDFRAAAMTEQVK